MSYTLRWQPVSQVSISPRGKLGMAFKLCLLLFCFVKSLRGIHEWPGRREARFHSGRVGNVVCVYRWERGRTGAKDVVMAQSCILWRTWLVGQRCSLSHSSHVFQDTYVELPWKNPGCCGASSKDGCWPWHPGLGLSAASLSYPW